jgi:hypothetical protein
VTAPDESLSPDGWRDRIVTKRWLARPVVALGAIALVAFALPFVIGRWAFPLGSINRDEAMYEFGARLLRSGHLTLPASYAPFRPWASGLHGDHLVLKYTPVWPAVLAIGNGAGSMRVGVAITSAVAVVLMALLGRELFGRWREGLLAAAILVCSPLFLLQAGTLLSYLFQLGLDLAIVLLVLGGLRRWPERGPAPRAAVLRLVGGGAVWGIALFAREFDAVLIALPLVAAAIAIGRRSPLRIATWAGWCALGAAAPLALLLASNWALLGSPLRNPFTVTGPYDTLFFGRRGIFPSGTFTFTHHDAITSFTKNFARLPGWTFGGLLLVGLACFGLWRNRRRGAGIWAVAGIAVSFGVGYALFWSPYAISTLWPGTRTMGPFYHLALLIPLALFGAAGLGALIDRTRVGAVIAIVAMVAITAVGLVTRVDRNRPITHQYRAAHRVIDAAHLHDAVLFMEDRGTHGYYSSAPTLENRPDLDQSILYANDEGSGDFAVLRDLPQRAPFRFRSELRPGDALLSPTHFVERLHVTTAPAVTLRFRVVNTTGATTVTTRLRAGHTIRTRVLDTHSHKGAAYTFTWTLSARPTTGHTAISLPPSRGTATVEANLGRVGQAPDRFELRYPYLADEHQVHVLEPGWGRTLFRFGQARWLNEDVSATLREQP